MSLRSLFTFSSNAIAAVLLSLLLVTGCTSAISITGSNPSSSTACAGDGGLFPSPIAPQAFKTWEKFEVPANLFGGDPDGSQRLAADLMRAGTPLVAIIDEMCVVAQPHGSRHFSQQLRSEAEAQASKSTFRAYPLRTNIPYSSEQLRTLVAKDPCLIHLSEDTPVTVSATVNDPQFSSQTHLPAIKAPTAWDTFHSGLTGDVVIAIIDDGMQMNHPDLSGVLWTNSGETPGNGTDDDGNGYVDDVNGYNFASSLGSPAHENGSTHGTHVAGLAAAQGDNSVGITGVMGRNAKIMVLNVFGASSSASSASTVNAINYARSKGAKVINMSLGGQGTAAAVNTAMVNAVAAGVFIAVAAGNSNDLVTASNFYQPMGYAKDISGALAIGSQDATTLQRSSFSNYSTTYVEIGAPGSNSATGGVLSTYPTSTYNYQQGTSMASPVLAGAAALLVGWVTSRGKTITPAQVESVIKSAADSRSDLAPFFAGGSSLNMANMAKVALCNY